MAEFENRETRTVKDDPAPRDPEDRPAPADDEDAQREKNMDKTLADSFPTSDPPSSIPDPSGDEG